MCWQPTNVLLRNYTAFISNFKEKYPTSKRLFNAPNCASPIWHECPKPTTCCRVHLNIAGSEISNATAIAHGLISLPMPNKYRMPAARDSSCGWPNHLTHRKSETKTLEAGAKAIDEEYQRLFPAGQAQLVNILEDNVRRKFCGPYPQFIKSFLAVKFMVEEIYRDFRKHKDEYSSSSKQDKEEDESHFHDHS